MVDSIIRSFDIWTDAQGLKSRRRIKDINNISLEGLSNLRKLILQLAVMGKLVKQDPNDEPASELIKKIERKKIKLITEGKLKKEKPLPPITDKEKPFELPKGWEWSRLNSVIDVRDGTHDSPKDAVGDNTFPLVTSKDFVNGKIDFNDARRISQKDHLEISKRSKVDKLDILFSMIGGNLGNQVIVTDERQFSVKNVALFKYYSKEYTSPFFIKKITEHLAASLQRDAIGGAQPFVALGYLRQLVIALPPIEEQKRIVAKINELMELCDELEKEQTNNLKTHQTLVKALLEALTQAKDVDELQNAWQRMSQHFDTLFCTEDSVDQLKQTILQLAVMGRLVKQDPNDEPAIELAKRIKEKKTRLIREEKIKKQIKLPEIGEQELPQCKPSSWSFERLGDILQVINGRAYKMHEMLSSGTPLLRVGNLFTSNEWYYSDLELDSEKYIDNGDLIYAWSASFGPFIWQGGRAIYHYHIWKLDFFDISSYDKAFMYLYLLSITQRIKASGNGIAMIHMTKERMEKMIIPFPPLAEQKRIVAKVDELMSLCDNLIKKIKNAQEIECVLSKTIVENALG